MGPRTATQRDPRARPRRRAHRPVAVGERSPSTSSSAAGSSRTIVLDTVSPALSTIQTTSGSTPSGIGSLSRRRCGVRVRAVDVIVEPEAQSPSTASSVRSTMWSSASVAALSTRIALPDVVLARVVLKRGRPRRGRSRRASSPVGRTRPARRRWSPVLKTIASQFPHEPGCSYTRSSAACDRFAEPQTSRPPSGRRDRRASAWTNRSGSNR